MRINLRILLMLSVLLGIISLSSCNSLIPSEKKIPAEKQCTADADCVPDGCCHPKNAVNKDFAPDCSETFCTGECAPNTLDCGQGEVRCVDKLCTAVLESKGDFS